ncbi:hypothetical protein N0V85_004734 [Neurospora sp. IMI 360204]|nr:hypothetical protein N0V85_004734 [Neurospora sp. IMI 360204]
MADDDSNMSIRRPGEDYLPAPDVRVTRTRHWLALRHPETAALMNNSKRAARKRQTTKRPAKRLVKPSGSTAPAAAIPTNTDGEYEAATEIKMIKTYADDHNGIPSHWHIKTIIATLSRRRKIDVEWYHVSEHPVNRNRVVGDCHLHFQKL